METFIMIVSFLILGLIVASPILLLVVLKKLNIRFYAVYYFLIGLFLMGGMMYIFAWWGYKSDNMLLEHYGYNMDAMNETERYGNVLPENIKRVKEIEISVMGIGYPLKSIFGFITFIPYLLVVYIGYWVLHIGKKKIRNKIKS